MPVRAFIGDASFTPEGMMALNEAFNSALAELNLADRRDPRAEMVAKKIIEIARLGERDPKRLCELALKDIPSCH
jgi:hypothetical protein